jgi:branched-chain amino acid transport system permease protein
MHATIVSIIVTGVFYSIQAMGFVLVFRGTGVFNFAQGFMLELGAYVTYSFVTRFDGKFWPAVVLMIVVMSCLGAILYRLVLVHLEGAALWASVMALFGIGYILDGYISLQWNAQLLYLVPPISTRLISLPFGFTVPLLDLVLTVVAIGMILATLAILQFTSIGLHMRAASENKALGAYCGLKIERIATFSWVLAAALIGFAGIAEGLTTSISPDLSNTFIAVFPAVVLGGMESAIGAIVGSFLLVTLIQLGTLYIAPDAALPISYTVLLIVLLVRPSGLFGAKEVVRI